jgi:hypothetical protein
MRPDAGRVYLSDAQALTPAKLRLMRRFRAGAVAHAAWEKRLVDSKTSCKHGGGCKRPEACTLGLRVQPIRVLTGALLPVWQRLHNALDAVWKESKTVRAWKRDVERATAAGKQLAALNYPPKAPLRVLHLTAPGTGEALLGLCLPHGVALDAVAGLKHMLGEGRLRGGVFKGGGGGGGGASSSGGGGGGSAGGGASSSGGGGGGGGGGGRGGSSSPFAAMSVSQLRAEFAARGMDTSGCVEKMDLVSMLDAMSE